MDSGPLCLGWVYTVLMGASWVQLGYCCSGQPYLQGYYSLPRLQTGWSVHTYQTEKQRRSQCLSPGELEVILQVIQRAERLDILEQQRIG